MKCSICNSRKGKRKCLVENSLVCSQCCGTTRSAQACSGCSYFQEPRRKYTEVPAYSVSEMERNIELESISNSIESALCSFDHENDGVLRDSDAIKVLELLIDTYHFKDTSVKENNKLILDGYNYVKHIIEKDLKKVDHEEIVKVLGVLRFVANRRTKIGREYMELIHQYIGRRVASGARIL